MGLTNEGQGGAKIPPRPSARPKAKGSGRSPAPGAGARAEEQAGQLGPRPLARKSSQRRRQKNVYKALGGAGAVVVVVAVLVAVSLTGATKKPVPPAGPVAGQYDVPAGLLARVEGVPVRALVSAAAAVPWSAWSAPRPGEATPPQALPAGTKALTQGGKPEIVFIGADYCPFCAAQRWALVMALSKFGTFSGLQGTSSSPTDIYPSTPTFSFYGSKFTSRYLSFVAVETETDTGAKLQAPTPAEASLLDKWDAPPYVASSQQDGSIPFVYMAGKYLLIGAQYDAAALAGMQFAKAAAYLTSGTNATAKGAMAAAGYLVGDICALTHGQPAPVCSQVPPRLVGVTTSSRLAAGT